MRGVLSLLGVSSEQVRWSVEIGAAEARDAVTGTGIRQDKGEKVAGITKVKWTQCRDWNGKGEMTGRRTHATRLLTKKSFLTKKMLASGLGSWCMARLWCRGMTENNLLIIVAMNALTMSGTMIELSFVMLHRMTTPVMGAWVTADRYATDVDAMTRELRPSLKYEVTKWPHAAPVAMDGANSPPGTPEKNDSQEANPRVAG